MESELSSIRPSPNRVLAGGNGEGRYLLRAQTEKMAGFSDISLHQVAAPPYLASSIAKAARRPMASPPLGRPGLAAGCQANVSRCTQGVSAGTKRRRKSAAVTAPACGESAELARS